MTESEWLTSDDTQTMLDSIPGEVKDRRKYQLLATAICWRIWYLILTSAAAEPSSCPKNSRTG